MSSLENLANDTTGWGPLPRIDLFLLGIEVDLITSGTLMPLGPPMVWPGFPGPAQSLAPADLGWRSCSPSMRRRFFFLPPDNPALTGLTRGSTSSIGENWSSSTRQNFRSSSPERRPLETSGRVLLSRSPRSSTPRRRHDWSASQQQDLDLSSIRTSRPGRTGGGVRAGGTQDGVFPSQESNSSPPGHSSQTVPVQVQRPDPGDSSQTSSEPAVIS